MRNRSLASPAPSRDHDPFPEGGGADPSCDERAQWLWTTVNATSEGYMVWRAVREAGRIVDWVVADANAVTEERWASAVGRVVGMLGSRLNAAADNSRTFEVFATALTTGKAQVLEVELALPGGTGGWRRLMVTPLDGDTVSAVTRDVSREHYLATALDRERRRLVSGPEVVGSDESGGVAETRLASRAASALFCASGLVALANTLLSRLTRVNVPALQITAGLSILIAAVVLVLPWKHHFEAVSNTLVGSTLVFLVVSDRFNRYSRAEAALAVYPVFFVMLIAWAGLTRSRGAASVAAALSAPALFVILAGGGHASVGAQSVVVTIPAAAALGEVLSWASHRARMLTNIEMQRRLRDPLTGLANRALLSIRIEHALARVRRGPNALAVLYLDLDHFKHINDTLGHNAGDDVLMEVARRLQSVARESDTIARIGGDEFVILCEDIEDLPGATKVAERILEIMDEPCTIDRTTTALTLSAGIAFSPRGIETPELLLQNADLALYRAKESGRACYEVYGDTLRDQLTAEREIELGLRQAIHRGELRAHYQPILVAGTGRLVGFEALLRWDRPGYGLIAPGEFIAVAEETGLIVELGAWILDEACRQVMRWNRMWPELGLGVSVNLAARQVLKSNIVTLVREVLAESELDPQLLTLELTESTVIDHLAAAHPRLEALRDLGVNLAIDDFGTGYSSLTYLRRLPINLLKIDRSFVSDIAAEGQNNAIVAGVINLAKTLGLGVVAEGVEEPRQLELLRELGCDFVQGYLFSPPKPAADIEPYIEAALGLQSTGEPQG